MSELIVLARTPVEFLSVAESLAHKIAEIDAIA